MRRLLVVFAMLAAGCGADGSRMPSTPTAPTPGAISNVARAHLEAVLGLMENNSLNRMTIDWNAVRAEVMHMAGAAQAIPDTFPAIRLAITRLRDGHSSYRGANGTVVFVPLRSCVGSGGPSPGTLPPNIGYVSVGAFGGTSAEALAFANGIHDRIRLADRDDLIGWIVDLRGNGGGNMWPMIAGLGPILGDGLLGYFIGPTGTETPWFYRDGASFTGTSLAQRVDHPYRLRRALPRVAVLSDNAIASSGEATLIAFRQRPNTRSFGAATCGLSTANTPFPLSDGGMLILTTALMADRSKTQFGDSIAPDEVIDGRERTLARAVEWLEGR